MARAPAPAAHLSQGRKTESTACRHLTKQGLKLLTRNYRSRFGEIDLIMAHRDTLVFVEVRYRNSERYGTPAETVNRRKQEKLRATAEIYLQQHKTVSTMPCRFDIVAITGDHGGGRIDWIQDAF